MAEILNQKRQEVVLSLIDNLNSKGNRDIEACLNAHLILTELTETDYTFAKLLEKENFVRLMQVACDAQNAYQGYALSVLSSIITEYPDFEKSVP
jgi:Holliday junction resolvasome RuvABC DNA-binding subunit